MASLERVPLGLSTLTTQAPALERDSELPLCQTPAPAFLGGRHSPGTHALRALPQRYCVCVCACVCVRVRVCACWGASVSSFAGISEASGLPLLGLLLPSLP